MKNHAGCIPIPKTINKTPFSKLYKTEKERKEKKKSPGQQAMNVICMSQLKQMTDDRHLLKKKSQKIYSGTGKFELYSGKTARRKQGK